MADALAREIDRASKLARDQITEYAAWRGKIQYGREIHAIYGDVLDFVNFRVETADSCLLLLANRRVADALGLCRALLENHLLFMLMCRGTKFFQLEDTQLKGAAFKAKLKEKQAELKQLQNEEGVVCLGVDKHPRRDGLLIYIFEGLDSPDPDPLAFGWERRARV